MILEFMVKLKKINELHAHRSVCFVIRIRAKTDQSKANYIIYTLSVVIYRK